ncbi:MAG: UMP kinase [Elusimicrobia bacterium RIFOXYB2_FULL_49_7]|nr:MAG: UMP kinase [Elusimicrobia bacterium RIFOXYB2_FULL_49_7]
MNIRFKRVLLKISGEALLGSRSFGLDSTVVERIADEVAELNRIGVQVAVVIGGGNIFRGLKENSTSGIDRTTADHMGMLGTVMNSLAMQDCLEREGVNTRVLSAIRMDQICEPFIKRRAVRHLEKGRVTIFAAGTGNPYFTTDTAGVLRAVEIKADAIIKATKVDGVYDDDPVKNKNAKKIDDISYDEVMTRHLKVMDMTAITLCSENQLPILVLNLLTPGNLKRAIVGEKIGTLIHP